MTRSASHRGPSQTRRHKPTGFRGLAPPRTWSKTDIVFPRGRPRESGNKYRFPQIPCLLFPHRIVDIGSRAAAEGQERGLDTGTSDPQRRPEGDQGRCTGCVRRERARPSPSVTVDLVCLVGAGHPRCSRPARSRRVQLVPSDLSD